MSNYSFSEHQFFKKQKIKFNALILRLPDYPMRITKKHSIAMIFHVFQWHGQVQFFPRTGRVLMCWPRESESAKFSMISKRLNHSLMCRIVSFQFPNMTCFCLPDLVYHGTWFWNAGFIELKMTSNFRIYWTELVLGMENHEHEMLFVKKFENCQFFLVWFETYKPSFNLSIELIVTKMGHFFFTQQYCIRDHSFSGSHPLLIYHMHYQ